MEASSVYISKAPALLSALVMTISHKLRNPLMAMSATLELMKIKRGEKGEEEGKSKEELLLLERLFENMGLMQGWIKELEHLYPYKRELTQVDLVQAIHKVCDEGSLAIHKKIEQETSYLPLDGQSVDAILQYLFFYLSAVGQPSGKSLFLTLRKGSFGGPLLEGKEGTILHVFQESNEEKILKEYTTVDFHLGDFDHLHCPGANLGINLCRTLLQSVKCKFRAMKSANNLYSFMVWIPN